MKILNYSDWDTLEMAVAPLPAMGPLDVLVKVAACGICGSELEGFKNRSPRRKPPRIMGHEFCGTIAAVGAQVTGWKEGDAVVGNAVVTCGHCVRCRRGDGHLCAAREILGMHRTGAFAEFVAVPASILLAWPENLPAEAACMAEPLANGVHTVFLSRHMEPESVLVLGAGPIGLLAQQAFQALTGARVFVSDRSPERLAVASKLGATDICVAGPDCLPWIQGHTGGEGADVVIDAAGSGVTKRFSIEALRPGGMAVWLGLHEDEMSLASYGLTLAEKHVIGSYSARLSELQTALDLMAAGRVDTTSWTQLFPLDEGVAAFRRMLAPQGDDIKAILLP